MASPLSALPELWWCEDCGVTGPLNERGNCGTCNSQAVMPRAVVNRAQEREPWRGIRMLRQVRPGRTA